MKKLQNNFNKIVMIYKEVASLREDVNVLKENMNEIEKVLEYQFING